MGEGRGSPLRNPRRRLATAVTWAAAGVLLLLCVWGVNALLGAPAAAPTPAVSGSITEEADLRPPATATRLPPSPVPGAIAIPPALSTAIPSPTPPPLDPQPDLRFSTAEVVRVVDGDTIRVLLAGQTVSVRYIGMDTPEMGSAGGEMARQQNAALVSGRTVRLEKDVSETDRYGRLLRYVWVGNLMVNEELVRQGHARAVAYPPDTRYQALFEARQREADAARRGFWLTAPRAAVDAVLRAGPGAGYPQAGSVPAGLALEIVARDQEGGWYQLVGGAWIAGESVTNAPDVPIAQ